MLLPYTWCLSRYSASQSDYEVFLDALGISDDDVSSTVRDALCGMSAVMSVDELSGDEGLFQIVSPLNKLRRAPGDLVGRLYQHPVFERTPGGCRLISPRVTGVYARDQLELGKIFHRGDWLLSHLNIHLTYRV